MAVIFTILLLSLFTFTNCLPVPEQGNTITESMPEQGNTITESMPEQENTFTESMPEQENTFAKSVSNWVNSVYVSGAYAHNLLRTPLNLKARNDERLTSVMESLCNMTQFMHMLVTINSTQAQDLHLVLEKAALEGCKLVKANISGANEITECTAEDLLSIQATCVSQQLAPAVNNILKQARRHFASDYVGYNVTNMCNWLRDRVPLSENVQEALNCS